MAYTKHFLNTFYLRLYSNRTSSKKKTTTIARWDTHSSHVIGYSSDLHQEIFNMHYPRYRIAHTFVILKRQIA